MLVIPQMKYNFREIPEELRHLNQWMPWKKIVRNGETTKSPCDLYGKAAARTDKKNWMSYEDAVSAYKDGFADGVGFCFTPDTGYVFIDADKCLSYRDIGDHKKIIQEFGSYSEYSQSGTGYHIIVKGNKPGKKTKRHKNGVGYEIYDNWYCCFTGDRIEEAKTTIESNQTAIDEFYTWLFGKDQSDTNNVVGIQEAGEVSDEQVVQKILDSKQGDVFLGLMKGDASAGATDDYSHSAALMRLCNILAFWTKDWMQIDRIVRESGLYYEKWDRISEVTIEKALSLVTDGYVWKQDNNEADDITPMPLPKRVTALPFPTEVFPSGVRNMVKAVAKSLGLPDDFIAVHVLNFAGTAIGKSRLIEIKQGYRQYPNLYTALIGETGMGKSPSLDKAFEPTGKLQSEAHESYRMAMEEYETRIAEYDAMGKQQKEQAIEPEKPTLREYYTSQATTEAIFKMLNFNPRGIVVKLDELSSLVKGMNQYKGGRGDDREHFLSCWANADIKINRVRDDEPLIIPKPFLSVTGNLPPDILPKLETQGEEDGFIDRFLFAYPDNQTLSGWTWDGVDPSIMQPYEMLIYRLYSLSDKESKVLGLSEDAKSLFERWYNNHIAEMQQEDFNPRLRGPYAKMTNQLARLALIIQVMNATCGQASDEFISGGAIDAAIKLVDYFKSSAHKVYTDLGTTKGDKRCLDAVEWIRNKGGVVSKREAQQGKLAGYKRASEIMDLFKELADLGYGIMTKIKLTERGRPVDAFKLF